MELWIATGSLTKMLGEAEVLDAAGMPCDT